MLLQSLQSSLEANKISYLILPKYPILCYPIPSMDIQEHTKSLLQNIHILFRREFLQTEQDFQFTKFCTTVFFTAFAPPRAPA